MSRTNRTNGSLPRIDAGPPPPWSVRHTLRPTRSPQMYHASPRTRPRCDRLVDHATSGSLPVVLAVVSALAFLHPAAPVVGLLVAAGHLGRSHGM